MNSPQTACRFDPWACGYDSSALQALLYRPVHAVVLEQCTRHIPDPHRVLDVGCGTGRLLRDAQLRFPDAQLVGVDISANMLSLAATASSRLVPIRGRAETLPFTSGVFDLVMATLTYPHWQDPAAGVAEIGRVLTDGGLFGLATLITPPTGARRHPRHWDQRVGLPESLVAALTRARLDVCDVDHIAGRGPIIDVTLVLAARNR